MAKRYSFAFDRRFTGLLSVLGIKPSRAHVEVADGVLKARFGPWVVRTPLANIEDVRVTGPHRPIRAIGPRFSPSTRSLTFGSNAQRTVRMRFRQPVPGLEPLGVVRHPALSVSVADPDALTEELRASGTVG